MRLEAVRAPDIALGESLYMVPAGVDDTGCPWFRAFSPTKMVAAGDAAVRERQTTFRGVFRSAISRLPDPRDTPRVVS